MANIIVCFICRPKKKNVEKFEQIFQERLHEHDEAIAKIEADFPDDKDKQYEAKREKMIRYDFRYVWFPSNVNLYKHNFKASADFRSATFSASADFSSATFSAVASFSSATFSAVASFSSATFSASADFSSATFSAVASFSSATFSAVASFSSATFSASAYFSSATFSASAYFRSATFSDYADFSSATFSAYADFRSATFEEKSQIFFIKTKFNQTVDFNYTNFIGFVAFEGTHNNRVFIGKDALLNLQNARIDDAEKVSFHTVRLEPSWFVNQKDVAGFVFTDCKWRYTDGKRLSVKQEIANLKNREVSDNPNEILTKACWQLADNHEESKSLTKASMFRKFANESKRLGDSKFKQPFTLHWWYWLVSFYGESWRRAMIVLLCLLVLFGLLFASSWASFELPEKEKAKLIAQQKPAENNPQEDKSEEPKVYQMNYGEGFVYSLSVATFQRPEPKPADTLTKLFIVLEIIFVPLQAALLALAIRRKFMR